MLERIPDQSLLADEGTSAPERIQATRGKDYAFVYSAYGRPILVRTKILEGKTLTAYWFDPRSGQSKALGPFDNTKGVLTFTPPLPARSPVPSQREDWVLVLDNSDKHYPMIGFP